MKKIATSTKITELLEYKDDRFIREHSITHFGDIINISWYNSNIISKITNKTKAVSESKFKTLEKEYKKIK